MKYFCNLLLISLLSASALAVETSSIPSTMSVREVRQVIEADSKRLSRLSVELDVLEEDLKVRRPDAQRLKAELDLLSEKMQRIRASLEAYDAQLLRFKKLSMEFLEIDQSILRLKKQEAILLSGPSEILEPSGVE